MSFDPESNRPGAASDAFHPSRRDLLKMGLGASVLVATSRKSIAAETTVLKRQDAATLSSDQKQNFCLAIRTMKTIPAPWDPTLNYYDAIVKMHAFAVRDAMLGRPAYGENIPARNPSDDVNYGNGHKTAAFFPFHRKVVHLFEQGLNAALAKNGKPGMGAPYWDWRDDVAHDVIFNRDFMGSATGDPERNYAVTEALSTHFHPDVFPINIVTVPMGSGDNVNQCPFPNITRAAATSGVQPLFPTSLFTTMELPTSSDVEMALKIENYDLGSFDGLAPTLYDLSFDDPGNAANFSQASFRNHFEGNWPAPPNFNPADPGDARMFSGGGLHNRVHAWIAGSWKPDANSWRFNGGTRTWSALTTAASTTAATGDSCDDCTCTVAAQLPIYVGTMLALQTSLNDPIFFLHHAFCDYLWHRWMEDHGKFTPATGSYAPASGSITGWNADDDMYPYTIYKGKPGMGEDITPASMAVRTTELGYEFVKNRDV
ncbi:MAG: tyrosinase family protein [Acidobacteriota bacterium]